MTNLTADFEAGVNGATITTGAGEASETAWDLVNGSPVYSNTHVAHGTLAAKIVAAEPTNLSWNLPVTTVDYGRVYLYATANPSIAVRVVNWQADHPAILCDTTGHFGLYDATGINYMATAMSLNQWIRVEWGRDDTGLVAVKLYNDAGSATPSDTMSHASGEGGGATSESITIGNQGGQHWGADYWLDNIVANATTWPGPTLGAQVLSPSADSVDGAWTDQAGGASLFAAIDETTASDADYIMSERNPNASGCRVKLAAGGDPAASDGHVIRWRIKKTSAGSETIDGTVKLYQGGGDSLGAGTLIADFDRTNVSGSGWTTFEETLSGGEADAITDYGDLYLEFYADTP